MNAKGRAEAAAWFERRTVMALWGEETSMASPPWLAVSIGSVLAAGLLIAAYLAR